MGYLDRFSYTYDIPKHCVFLGYVCILRLSDPSGYPHTKTYIYTYIYIYIYIIYIYNIYIGTLVLKAMVTWGTHLKNPPCVYIVDPYVYIIVVDPNGSSENTSYVFCSSLENYKTSQFSRTDRDSFTFASSLGRKFTPSR